MGAAAPTEFGVEGVASPECGFGCKNAGFSGSISWNSTPPIPGAAPTGTALVGSGGTGFELAQRPRTSTDWGESLIWAATGGGATTGGAPTSTKRLSTTAIFPAPTGASSSSTPFASLQKVERSIRNASSKAAAAPGANCTPIPPLAKMLFLSVTIAMGPRTATPT